MATESLSSGQGVDREVTLMKACADPTRLRILFLLAERELCVCELVAVLQMPQGKVSRHLGHLRHAGVVIDRRDGTWVHYRLAAADSSLMRALLEYLSAEREAQPLAAADLRRLKRLGSAGALCSPPTSAASN